MSNKPVPSSPQEDSSSSKPSRSCWGRCRSPLIFCLVLGTIITSLLLYYRPWQIHTLYMGEIDTLKNLITVLNDRISHLESSEKAASTSPNSEQIHAFENHITTLQQQVEALQNQPKMGEPSGQTEKSQILEKDLTHLAESQKVIKTILIFWRLKNKVLSDAPYASEWVAYKAISKPDETLALLEKYADQGLQVLKAAPGDQPPTSSGNETTSWWSRFKAAVGSLIKIEKVDAPIAQSVSSTQDRQAIEDLLTRIDQTLTQQLDLTLPGDVLK